MSAHYPLSWPPGRKRTPAAARGDSRFKVKHWDREMQLLEWELQRLGARNPVLSTNQELRMDGLPRAQQSLDMDPGVALYFDLHGRKHTFACDRWRKVIDNVHAIRLTIEAIRGIGRWGSGEMVDLAFTGFAALPPPGEGVIAMGGPPPKPWWEVLGVGQDAPLAVVEAVYKARIKMVHPDAGGSADQTARLNAAIAEARKILKGAAA